MAGISSNKHNRDQSLEFQGFLNNLQDWEHSLKEKDKKLKGQVHEEKKVVSTSQKIGMASEVQGQTRKASMVEVNKPSNALNSEVPLGSNYRQQYDYVGNSNAISRISSGLSTEEGLPDAASEKELGNEYYKQKNYMKAIECYSRSIALSPTAITFANRGMACIKIKKFEEAENDCTEALNLDDRYIKAYSRRAAARKELGKLKASMEDSDFGLRLDPNNQELRKLYTEVKTLYDKEITEKMSGVVKNSIQGIQGLGDSKMEAKRENHDKHVSSSHSKRAGIIPVQVERIKDDNGKIPSTPRNLMMEIESRTRSAGIGSGEKQLDGSRDGATPNPSINDSKLHSKHTGNGVDRKRDLKSSVQELASHAASRAMAAAAKNITTPKSAYQFEVSWRALSDDHALQARLLKTIPPTTLPQIFKNALSAPILIDIIKCVATFFKEERELAVTILWNLTKVSRFDMIIMCLSAADKADLSKIWDEVFSDETVMVHQAEMLTKLRLKYCPGGWQMHVLESNGWIKEMS